MSVRDGILCGILSFAILLGAFLVATSPRSDKEDSSGEPASAPAKEPPVSELPENKADRRPSVHDLSVPERATRFEYDRDSRIIRTSSSDGSSNEPSSPPQPEDARQGSGAKDR